MGELGTEPANSTGDEGAMNAVVDAIEGAITGVPAPLKRVAWDTFGKLVTGVADIGVAKLEGIAQEIRATTAARLQVISTSGTQMAEHIDVDPAYGRAAGNKYAAKILRKQMNVDKTCGFAAEELKNIAPPVETAVEAGPDSQASVSDDWINAFDEEAGNMSTEYMQRHFGRILAGEIAQPGSFSIRTIKLMGQLDNQAAKLFTQFCSLAMAFYGRHQDLLDVRVMTVGERAAANGLMKFGMAYDDLTVLSEYGLVIPEYNSAMPYANCVVRHDLVGAYFVHQGRNYGLKPGEKVDLADNVLMEGPALTRAGKELYSIVQTVPTDEYTNAFIKFVESRGYSLADVNLKK
ncbi:DUF2806 domain-containing protein [Acidovorax sp. LjRoot118]|uniref:DUF2806 domain-containing protein n=1 Tax=Acidovorax sp. LjRoot118 TaxID=3342256 RepID=UPI003ED0C565